MHTGQLLIIILFSTITGWLVSWLLIKILFWPLKPVKIGPVNLQGLVPAKQPALAGKAGSLIQQAFDEYKGFEEKISGPALLEKLKPQIEDHVDHFLNEKLKTVFPILAQFMGEKTLNQFKNAFLVEIDTLFPELMKTYMNELRAGIRLDNMIAEKINTMQIERLRDMFYSNAAKPIRYFYITGACIGLFTGLITVLLLLLVNI